MHEILAIVVTCNSGIFIATNKNIQSRAEVIHNSQIYDFIWQPTLANIVSFFSGSVARTVFNVQNGHWVLRHWVCRMRKPVTIQLKSFAPPQNMTYDVLLIDTWSYTSPLEPIYLPELEGTVACHSMISGLFGDKISLCDLTRVLA